MIASAANVAGDPDTWPEAAVYASAIAGFCYCFYIYVRYWGHDDDDR